MKLYQLIEKGMKLIPEQTYFQYFEYDDNDNIVAACPIGTAYFGSENKHLRIVTTDQVTQTLLKKHSEIFQTKVNWCHRCGIKVGDIISYTLHLNDDHMYSKPEIVKILREVED